MKVLWLINAPFPELCAAAGLPVQVKEGWIQGLYNSIKKEFADGGHKLYIAFPQFVRTETIQGEYEDCVFFGFYKENDKPYVYNDNVTKRLKEIVGKVCPDVVHIAGTEYDHACSMVRAYGVSERTVVSIQGMTSVYARHYMADLPFAVQHGRTFRDIIKCDNLNDDRKKYIRRGKMEEEVIRLASHVVGRTQWDRACTRRINPDAAYHHCGEILRTPFYDGVRWSAGSCERHSVFVSQGYYPIKGLHYMIEAMADIKRFYNDAHLYVGGGVTLNNSGMKQRIRQKEYQRYLAKLIEKHELWDCIVFLPSLDAEGMKERFLRSNVFVSPSSIENSPNSLGEAMILGVPCVSSYVGGVMDMLEHGREGYIYQHDASYMLAHYVMNIFDMTDRGDAELNEMTKNAAEHAGRLFDRVENGRCMMEIYREIARGNTSHGSKGALSGDGGRQI